MKSLVWPKRLSSLFEDDAFDSLRNIHLLAILIPFLRRSSNNTQEIGQNAPLAALGTPIALFTSAQGHIWLT